jgi:hypothetical protein
VRFGDLLFIAGVPPTDLDVNDRNKIIPCARSS